MNIHQQQKKRVTVVGGANIDITATPLSVYHPFDSTPSRVDIGFGGVGRNIAHNLCLMGVEVRFLTIFGDDAMALALQDDCRRIGMKLEPLLHAPHERSNYFICVNNEVGEMQAGAADMELMTCLTASMIESEMERINACEAVVADCNVSPEVLECLFSECRVPLYIDGTSGAKALKLRSLLGSGHAAPITLKLNRAEAEALSGITDSAEEAARWFIRQGIDRIFITLGAQGVCCADADETLLLPAQHTEVVNATGAGDAFMAGVVSGLLADLSLKGAAERGQAAAVLTLQCSTAVSDEVASLFNN